MQIHPRTKIVNAAELQLREAVDEMLKKDLTTAEVVQVLSRVLGGYLQQLAKFAIRDERHGDTNQPGDAA